MGVWTSGRSHIEIPEDQQKFAIPMDRTFEKVFYNMRIAIDNKVLTEPRVWRISKINRIDANGIGIFTCAQDKFNPNADYLDEDGNWWANYFDPATGAPTAPDQPEPIDNVHGVITCAGSQNIKVGGSYKKLTISYYDGETPIEARNGTWHFSIDGADASSLVVTKSDATLPHEIKVKFIGESTYIGKELGIRFIPDLGDAVDFSIPIISL